MICLEIEGSVLGNVLHVVSVRNDTSGLTHLDVLLSCELGKSPLVGLDDELTTGCASSVVGVSAAVSAAARPSLSFDEGNKSSLMPLRIVSRTR